MKRYLRKPAETGWHRAQRRRRTRSHFVLAAFLSGVPNGAHKVAAAAQCLNSHHSRSSLGKSALKRLQLQTRLPVAIGTMSSATRHAWCGQCHAHRPAKTAYCPTCGNSLKMYTVPAQSNSQPWRQPFARRKTSPRRRQQEAPVPKGQGAGKGKQPRQPKTDKGKGKGQAPAIADLPKPAAAPTIPVPKPATSSGQETSEEGDLLGALLAHIGDSGSLPSSLAERVQSFQATNARSTGKLLRKQVARQTEARTQLQKLSKDRQLFLDGWAEYLQVLTDTVEQQLVKMSKVLEEFDTAEAQWQAQLSEATDLLSKASTGTSPAPKSNEAMDEEDTTVAQAAAEESRKRQTEKIQQGQKELIEALNKAKAAAEVQRDGSRAPRRRPKDDDVVDLERRPQ